MSILKTIEEVFTVLPIEKLAEGNTIFIELDSINYNLLNKEIGDKYTILSEQNVPDIGKGMTLNFMGHNIIVAENKKVKTQLDTFYIAFKAKILW